MCKSWNGYENLGNTEPEETMQFGQTEIEGGSPFGQHVNNLNSLRGTMFYVCQGSCLCGTVNNRGKVIYCYGDIAPKQFDVFSEKSAASTRTTPRDLLAAQLGIWVFGLIALLIVLLLIRKSISSLRSHIEKVTERLPWYHDDDDLLSNHSTATSPHIHGKDTTMESMGSYVDLKMSDLDHVDGGRTPLPHHHQLDHPDTGEAELSLSNSGPPLYVGTASPLPTNKLRKHRLKGKDFKKGGDALRGKNVFEAYRIKGKEIKRTMK